MCWYHCDAHGNVRILDRERILESSPQPVWGDVVSTGLVLTSVWVLWGQGTVNLSVHVGE